MARIAKIFTDSEDEDLIEEAKIKSVAANQRQDKKFINPSISTSEKSNEPQVFRFGGKIISTGPT